MPFIDALKIIDIHLLKERNLLGIIYLHKGLSQTYFALMRITSNSIYQLVTDINISLKNEESFKLIMSLVNNKRILI